MRTEKRVKTMIGAMILMTAGCSLAAAALEQNAEPPIADAITIETESPAIESAQSEATPIESAKAILIGPYRFVQTAFAGVVPSNASMTSALRITNRGPAAGTATVILLDAATGTQLATWTSPSIAKFGAIQKSVADIAAATPPVPATVAAITVLAAPTRALRLEHIVTSAGVLSDFTNVCL